MFFRLSRDNAVTQQSPRRKGPHLSAEISECFFSRKFWRETFLGRLEEEQRRNNRKMHKKAQKKSLA
jgi:hypothetical protein